MKQLLFLFAFLIGLASFIPSKVYGQTRFSQLSTALPDTHTSLVGLKNVSGVYTDYLFTLSQLATYINTGSVTSVGLSMPGVFSVTPTTITSSGTFTVVAAGGQPANQFYATPNGTSGALGLRSITAADLPTVGTPGTYGDATHIPSITTDAQGRVTAVSTYSVGASMSTIVAAADFVNQVTTMGGIIYTPSTTSTIVVSGYITVNLISTDQIFYQFQWTDENGNPESYLSSYITTAGYFNIPPLVIRVHGGSAINFQTAFHVSGGSINYDVGWKALQ